jgi:hypothetical protein
MPRNHKPFQPVRTIYSVDSLITDFEAVRQDTEQQLAEAQARQSALLVPARQAALDANRSTLDFLFKLKAENVQEIATSHPLSDGSGPVCARHPDHDLISQIRKGQVHPV